MPASGPRRDVSRGRPLRRSLALLPTASALIDPFAPRRLRDALWDALIVLAATGAAVYVPLSLLPGFVDPERARGAELALTVLFTADLMVQARRLRSVPPQRRRLARLAFAADVLAALPLGLIGPPVLLLARLFKLVRVVAGMRALSRRHIGQASRLRLAYLAYGLGLTLHLIACGFLGLGGVMGQQPEADQYLDALYWGTTTLTTVGYGDMLPRTPVQKVYAIGVMLLGVGVYAFLIGNIASLLTRLDPLRAAHLQQRERLDAFMRYRELPLDLRRRIQAYHDYVWDQRLVIDEDEVLEDLPPGLRAEVALHLRRNLVEGVPLFEGASEAFIRDVALQMRPVVAFPGDVIVREGHHGREMYVLARGTVEAVDAEGRVLREMHDGDFFGEVALVTDAPRTATVRAVTTSDLYVLDRAMYERVSMYYPAVAAALAEAARQRTETDGG